MGKSVTVWHDLCLLFGIANKQKKYFYDSLDKLLDFYAKMLKHSDLNTKNNLNALESEFDQLLSEICISFDSWYNTIKQISPIFLNWAKSGQHKNDSKKWKVINLMRQHHNIISLELGLYELLEACELKILELGKRT